MKYIISLSGGKDSTASLLWALDNLPREDLFFLFIDTKWEHHITYEYINYLENKLNINIFRLESEGFENMCIRKKFIPNVTMRFCTKELKIKPFLKFLYENFILKNVDFIVIEGIRKEESKSRFEKEVFEVKKEFYNRKSFFVKKLYPILYWSKNDVFEFIRKHKIEKNPLYNMGFTRVGCMPCIFYTKELLYLPDEYKKRVKDLEDKISLLRGEKVKFFNNADKYLNSKTLFDFTDEKHLPRTDACARPQGDAS